MPGTIGRQLLRLAGEAGALTFAVAAAGRILEGPLGGFPREAGVNRWLVQRRTPVGDRLSWAVSTYSDTVPTIVLACAVAMLRWRRGRDPLHASLPVAAIALETAVFMSAAAMVGRARPDVARLDRPAPTSSFPSGHTGASTALHLVLADGLAGSGCRGGRPTAFLVRALVPPAVGWSRLYRGMHHPTDVAVGLLVGAWAGGAVRRVAARAGEYETC
ncbi:MAG: phosphatase PAP2 family protein [Dermatophilaceae bacterium]